MIHGANGTGAGFDPLAAELRRRGHHVVAPDLPCEDREADFSAYARAVPEGDVFVGHSMGGITASLAADGAGSKVAYVAALLPQEGRTLAELFAAEPMMCPAVADALVKGEDGLRYWGEGEAERFGLDPALLRGQAVTPYFETLPAPAPGPYVVCRQDRVVSPLWGREAAARLLGVEVCAIAGGHMPQAERPAELADLLGA